MNYEHSTISYRLTQNVPRNTKYEIFLYICRESSTNSPLFMQNEPNFQKSQMNVNLYNTTDYENKSNWTLGENEPNQSQLKPIKANSNPIQSQYKPNQSQSNSKRS